MVGLAAWAEFGMRLALIDPKDAFVTLDNIEHNMLRFRQMIAAFAAVALLDILVAWGLHEALKDARPARARLMAWLRVAYAAIFVAAIASLMEAAHLVAAKDAAGMSTELKQTLVMQKLAAYDDSMALAFLVFAAHLFVLMLTIVRKHWIEITLAILLFVAAFGYVFDQLHVIIAPDCNMAIGMYTAWGELALIGWLLFRKFDLPGNGA